MNQLNQKKNLSTHNTCDNFIPCILTEPESVATRETTCRCRSSMET